MKKEYHPETQLVRLVITGSVDDGKSTLVGRLLLDLGEVYEDQLKAVERTSSRQGMSQVDLSLLTDGLSAEREQKITIDVAYRYLNIHQRRFIIADVPGHEQYTRNMISGASDANAAIILIDVRKGLSPQSKRHLFIMSLLNINHILVVMNKMDLVGYSEEIFDSIKNEFQEFAAKLNIRDLQFIPVSALNGDMVVDRGDNMDWYQGATLFGYLENTEIASDRNLIDFRFPVQLTLKDEREYRSYAGQVEGGAIKVGEPVLVLPSMERSKVESVIVHGEESQSAFESQPAVLTLADELDISRGDVIVRENNVPEVSNRFEAMVCWMDRKPLQPDKGYLIKHLTQNTRAFVDRIVYCIDINNLGRQTVKELSFNEIGRLQLRTNVPLIFDPYTQNKNTGGFILIDDITKQTVGAGQILRASRSPKEQRDQKLKISQGGVIWFTGLPSSGKSTLADALADELKNHDISGERLDGDIVRETISRDLGFSAEDRRKNIERVVFVSKILARNGILVLASFISPQRTVRDWARSEIPNFVEIYTQCSLEECIKRDPRGNYRKALAGEITNFTGISDTYEEPLEPELVIETDKHSVTESVRLIINKLVQIGYFENLP